MPILWRDALKFAFTTSGLPFVIASGETKKQGLLVDSWDTQDQVSPNLTYYDILIYALKFCLIVYIQLLYLCMLLLMVRELVLLLQTVSCALEMSLHSSTVHTT